MMPNLFFSYFSLKVSRLHLKMALHQVKEKKFNETESKKPSCNVHTWNSSYKTVDEIKLP